VDEPPLRPTKAQVAGAAHRIVPDVIADGLDVLFVGINPGLYSAAIGHHFGRPGNRFWPALHLGGFTPRLLSPWENELLRDERLGITNVVERASARADELTAAELVAGAAVLAEKIDRHAPRVAALLGITSYRIAFGRPKATLGLQAERIGDTELWVLPNPSGLNAHYLLPALGRLFAELRDHVRPPETG
jgi:double-stranded uracil-DNA glycosylase